MAADSRCRWWYQRSGKCQQGRTIKTANFPAGLEKLEGAKSYADWIFEYVPSQVPGLSKPPAAPVAAR